MITFAKENQLKVMTLDTGFQSFAKCQIAAKSPLLTVDEVSLTTGPAPRDVNQV